MKYFIFGCTLILTFMSHAETCRPLRGQRVEVLSGFTYSQEVKVPSARREQLSSIELVPFGVSSPGHWDSAKVFVGYSNGVNQDRAMTRSSQGFHFDFDSSPLFIVQRVHLEVSNREFRDQTYFVQWNYCR